MAEHFSHQDFWNTRYADDQYIYGDQPNDFLLAQAACFKPGNRILCLAEGEGRNAVFLAEQGCAVTGVDFSTAGRSKALAPASRRQVTIRYDIGNLTAYDMGKECWHGIVSVFCHLAVADRLPLYQRIQDALLPGGIFLLESYNQQQLAYKTGGPNVPSHLVTLAELTECFSGYTLLVAEDLERDVREGSGHTGKASVTRLLARKPQ